jgi:hypothetical protein
MIRQAWLNPNGLPWMFEVHCCRHYAKIPFDPATEFLLRVTCNECGKEVLSYEIPRPRQDRA